MVMCKHVGFTDQYIVCVVFVKYSCTRIQRYKICETRHKMTEYKLQYLH